MTVRQDTKQLLHKTNLVNHPNKKKHPQHFSKISSCKQDGGPIHFYFSCHEKHF